VGTAERVFKVKGQGHHQKECYIGVLMVWCRGSLSSTCAYFGKEKSTAKSRSTSTQHTAVFYNGTYEHAEMNTPVSTTALVKFFPA